MKRSFAFVAVLVCSLVGTAQAAPHQGSKEVRLQTSGWQAAGMLALVAPARHHVTAPRARCCSSTFKEGCHRKLLEEIYWGVGGVTPLSKRQSAR